MVTIPIASRALIIPGPKTATMAMARSRAGKAEKKPRAIHHPAELVAHISIDPHQVLRAILRAAQEVDTGSLPPLDSLDPDQHLLGVIGREPGGENRGGG